MIVTFLGIKNLWKINIAKSDGERGKIESGLGIKRKRSTKTAGAALDHGKFSMMMSKDLSATFDLVNFPKPKPSKADD